MSRRFWSRVLTALVLSLSLLVLPVVSSASAEDTVPPAAPVFSDPCGLSQDGYTIPNSDNYVYGDVAGNGIDPGWHSSTSASTVKIDAYDTTYYNIVESWTFTFTNATCGTAASNKFALTGSKTCLGHGLYWWYHRGTASFTNVADSTRRYIDKVLVDVTVPGTPYLQTVEFNNGGKIADGETATAPLELQVKDFSDPGPKLTTFVVTFYHVTFYQGSGARVLKQLQLTLPRCGSLPARGSLYKAPHRKLRAVLDTRYYTHTARVSYRLTQKIGNRPTKVVRRWSVVKNVRRSYIMRVSSNRKVSYALQVRRPSGKWVVLDRLSYRRR